MGNAAAPGLTEDEIRDLREIAGTMIPADPALGMPGADDPDILADIVQVGGPRPSAGPRGRGGHRQEVRRRLRWRWIRTDAKPCSTTTTPSGGAPAATLGRVILGAYYRDDRVLIAIGHEARAPFPKGYDVEQGDWSLLDPVRRRAKFWRDDRTATEGDR